jgi:hypothetical protein
MTDAVRRSDRIRRIPSALTRHPIALWAGFFVVHVVLSMLALYAPGYPLGDVTFVYLFWVEHGLEAGIWPGIDTSWVYPIVALVPMIVAYLFGPDFYVPTWLTFVMIMDAAAFAVITAFGRDPRVARVGWWWLAFLLLLGPVALGRIDAVMVPIAIVGMLALGTMPRLAAVLLTVATWIKVWPAALIAAIVVTVRERWTVALTAIITSALIGIVALLLGAGTNVFSFITEQAGRGLQVESPIGTFWMWDAFVTRSSRSIVYYDQAILTYQVVGPGAVTAANLTTPVLAIVTAALLVLGAVAIRRGVDANRLLPPLALAITTALILFNKVGSPQFVTWLAVPIVFGLTASLTGRGPSFRVPVVLGLVIAAATQALYPYLYGALLSLNFVMLLGLTARNVLYVVLLGWAVVAVFDEMRCEPVELPTTAGIR